MKTALLCLAVGAMLSAVNGNAQLLAYEQSATDQAGHFYVSVDLGGSLLQDVTVKNLGIKASFDPGVRGDFIFGYNITDPLAVEFETGGIWNSFDSSSRRVIFPLVEHADLFQVPFLANLVFKVPLQGGFTPYIGGGAGGVASTIELSNDHNFGFNNHHHESDTDFTFAYQGMAGLKYSFAWNMEVDVSYKFLGTLDHSWFGGNPVFVTETGSTYSHSLLASFTFRF
jgi:OmpA-OmpF porin, OOP family